MPAAAQQRLTRAESRERTRALVVAAAARLFLRDGFGATSLEQVADEAGFTIGAVYSNFPGKTALGIAVIDDLYAREEQRLAETLAGLRPVGGDAWFEALAAWADDTIGDPAWTRLEIEIAAASAGDDALRAATAERFARLRSRWADLVPALAGKGQAIDAETTATAILALAIGIGAQRAADPKIPGSALSDALRAMVRER